MEFIFMLTHADRTVAECRPALERALAQGVRHVGFKDVGVPAATLADLAERLRAAGAVSYLEVVDPLPERRRAAIATAAALGIDQVLGGQDIAEAGRLLGTGRYFPFAGRPLGHPTSLAGTPADIAADCRAAMAAGCGGVDLLAYRATEAEPLDLVRAARAALAGGRLIVAGSVASVERIKALAAAGVDAITVGTAAFDGAFVPGGGLEEQLAAILAACGG